ASVVVRDGDVDRNPRPRHALADRRVVLRREEREVLVEAIALLDRAERRREPRRAELGRRRHALLALRREREMNLLVARDRRHTAESTLEPTTWSGCSSYSPKE